MAIVKTSLKPDVSYQTASGNPCTFNTGLGGHGKDLQKCVVSFMATQSGSGTPSPDNVRPITLVNSVNLSANSVPVIVPLGDSYGGGVVDLLTGKMIVIYVAETLDNNRKYTYSSTSGVRVLFVTQTVNLIKTGDSGLLPLCDKADTPPQSLGVEEWCVRSRYSGTPNRSIYVDVPLYENITTENELKAYFANNPFTVVYPLNTPIELSLTPTQITQIASQNTITGGSEITNIEVDYLRIGPTSVSGMAESFKIPEVSYPEVSGAIASFNTDFALPLKNGEFSVEAYQEGSGDPSPMNNRPIHGFSEVNVTRCGKNLFDINNLTATGITISDNVASGTVFAFYDAFNSSMGGIPNLPKFKTNTRYTLSLKAKYDPNSFGNIDGLYFRAFYTDGSSSRLLSEYITLDTTDYVTFTGTTEANKTLDRISITYSTGGPTKIYLKYIQIEESLQATSYEPYTGNTYTIQLGQEVYGGYVDVVNKKLILNMLAVDLGSLTWIKYVNNVWYNDTVINNADISKSVLCDIYKYNYAALPNVRGDNTINLISYYGTQRITIYDQSAITYTPEQFKSYVNGHDCVYNLVEPIEISLSDIPTLSTIIGNNTIFCDTGDSKVQYIKVSP